MEFDHGHVTSALSCTHVKLWVNTSDVQLSVFTETFTAWHSSVTYKNHQFVSDSLAYQINVSYKDYRLPTQNSKLKRSCDDSKWYFRPCRKKIEQGWA